MLRTLVAKLRNEMPRARLAVLPERQATYEQRASLQLAHVFPAYQMFPAALWKFMVRSSLATNLIEAPYQWLMPRQAEQLYGIVKPNRVDALLDIAGYSYGDAFPWVRCRLAAVQAQKLARRGKPVILMPQMFGPFDHPKTRRYFQQLCDACTLIYAREPASYQAVQQVIGDDPRLKIAPDVTIFSPQPAEVQTPHDSEAYAVLVPNERMLDQGGDEWGDSYLSRMVEAGKRMHQHGLRPAVVVHSADAGDTKLAEQLVAELSAAIGADQPFLFVDPNPLVLKKFISRARFLVGSRFHSLVAALSSAVPGLALGWAHKYEMLANDFGVPELIHRGANTIDELLSQVDMLCDQSENDRICGTLRAKRESMQTQSAGMWTEVLDVLRAANPDG